ncbi:uncharacterized protein LOC8066238 [Sorghum bicolor]|uniref:Uncharacterized protein n=1 Tax=Sorghum bicolor TaxID=4558 RepID=A0A1B6QMC4_SORBI|nr:uncharacterized protein LOC8066238 [Sorghum bicolor]KXG39070.1 hypothetical protein SORBI_3001G326000 [Sorghum bicolor]|eukprot:XP_002465070.2 uncharacterized protein LOC8066238 [Sorghum bicolor]
MERRLRAIAPKPLPPPAPPRSLLWRGHKRGRDDHLLLSPPVSKREREATSSSSSSSSYPYPYPYPPPPLLPAAGVGLGRYMSMPEGVLAGCEERLRGLSLVAGSPAAAAAAVPVERDLISKLQVPKVIKPRPARPLCTTICIDSSNIADAVDGGGVAYPETTSTVSVSSKTAREVETELELPGALPAVVSGHHHNRVHLVNDAYKAMVGQPVCPWLDYLPGGAGAGVSTTSRRINGIVVLDVRKFGPAAAPPRRPPDVVGGSVDAAFPCTARITWEQGGGNAIASLTVPCTVEHLIGSRSGDYRYIWRFDSSRASIIYCIT